LDVGFHCLGHSLEISAFAILFLNSPTRKFAIEKGDETGVSVSVTILAYFLPPFGKRRF
jgi:hypothetical protein